MLMPRFGRAALDHNKGVRRAFGGSVHPDFQMCKWSDDPAEIEIQPERHAESGLPISRTELALEIMSGRIQALKMIQNPFFSSIP